MSNDISTMYTKEQNKAAGRKGYYNFKKEKNTVISPKSYGIFREKKKRDKIKWRKQNDYRTA